MHIYMVQKPTTLFGYAVAVLTDTNPRQKVEIAMSPD